MYKLIACDLDETLLNDDKHICLQNIIAIKKLADTGVKFVPATGRGYKSIEQTLKELGLDDQVNEYTISFNGACITENKNNNILNFEALPYEIASKLYLIGLKKDVCIHVYTKDMVYVCNMNTDERQYMTGRHQFKEIDWQDLTILKNTQIAKVLFENTNQDYLQIIAQNLGNIAKKLDISYSSNRYVEFNKFGVNKGAGLKWLAELLNVNLTDTIAIGDNYNDLSMIKAAALGVGVKNTNPKIKNKFDYITTKTNNEGAVAEVIEHFILNH